MNIYLKDYSHLYDGDDATLALQEALYQCKKHPGATLKLGGGTLHFRRTYTAEKDYYITNNDHGPKRIVFPIIGYHGLTIDGEGAELIFHGAILPFVIDDSSDITLRNFTVDYAHPFFFQGTILSADEHHCELSYDPDVYELTPQAEALTFACQEEDWSITASRLLVTEFEADTKAPSAHLGPYFTYFPDASDGSFLQGMYRFVKPSIPQPGHLRFDGALKLRHTVGNVFVCTFSGRHNPGIFGNCSKDILVEDVTLYHVPSMGLVCQLCDNVTMVRFKTIVRPGSDRYLSVNADSTHFLNCTGLIRYESCTFLNMLDDAGNVHGVYLRFLRAIDDCTALLDFGHFQQRGVNPYVAGDVVNIVDNLTMQPIAQRTVASAELISNSYVRLSFTEPMPPMKAGYAIENFTRMPELIINNTESGDNRPRGFLLSTRRHTEVTNCTFHNMNCSLHLTGDTNDWFESGPCNDVVIRHNRFVNAAYAGGAVIAITPNIKQGNAPYHSNILIEDNVFELQDKRFLQARCADGITMRNNIYRQNPNLPNHGHIGDTGIALTDCPNAAIELPKEE